MSLRKDGFDEFGNPLGKAFDLGGVDDERLRGEKILLYVAYVPNAAQRMIGEYFEWHLAQMAVAERNIQMDIMLAPGGNRCSLDEKVLAAYSQLWYVSDRTPTLKKNQVQMIADYVKDGNGLLIWADNMPFYADANLLAKSIVGASFSGNEYGNKVLVLGQKLGRGYFIEHPLTQGVNNLYEGITICTIQPTQDLTILAQSHDGQMCMACFERGNQRVVLDTGFTKLRKGAFYKTAGTARYFRNIAFWLARGTRNVEYKSFTPGRESLATINPGATSERYKYTVAVSTRLTFLLHWEGAATLGLVVQDPQGRTVFDSTSPTAPIRAEVTAKPGDWVCWVKGASVPRPAFPYVLTLVLHKGAVAAATIPPPAASPKLVPTPPAPVAAAPSKRLPIFVILDDSNRASDFAPNLNLGLRFLADHLRSRPLRGIMPALGLIAADDSGRMVTPLTDITRFSLPALPHRGRCKLGMALNTLLSNLPANLGDGKPLIIILLTGAPDDDWTARADQLRTLAVQGKANVFAFGVGGYADPAVLKRLTPAPPLSLPVLTQVYAQQTFEWLYQIADVILSGMHGGASGQSHSVPPPPVCLKSLT